MRRWKKIFQIKEQDRKKKKKLKEKKKTKSEVKISKLPNKEFEAMIIMMSNETQEKDG